MFDEYIRGHACPECGGCNFYCADCTDPRLVRLESVAAAARDIVGKKPWLEPLTEGEPDLGQVVHVFLPIGRWLALQDALYKLKGAGDE